MELDPRSVQNGSQSLISSLTSGSQPEVPFSDFLSEAKDGDGDIARIVKIGSLKYRVVTENRGRESASQSDDESASSDDVANENEIPESQYASAQANLIVNLRPVNSAQFATNLNGYLQVFIHETVLVIKEKSHVSDDVQFRFKFANMNLEVIIGERNDKLTIQLKTTHQELKEFFTEENKMALLQSLREELPDEDIELVFENLLSGGGTDEESDGQESDGDDESESADGD